MTREGLEERLAQLRAGLAQLEADVHATRGAIDECEHWLRVLEADRLVNEHGREWLLGHDAARAGA